MPAPAPAMSYDLQEQQKLLVQHLMALTPEQIEKLPPDQRQQIQQLKQLFNMRF